jgi:hypothetical protein
MHDARRERAPTGACTQRSRATGSTKTTAAPLRTARAAPAETNDAIARERRSGGPLCDVAKATKSGGAAKKCVERRENDARRDCKSTSNEKSKKCTDCSNRLYPFVHRRKGEFFQVVRVRGDGRCMFRSLALGLAALTGRNMTSGEEEFEADQLRLAVAESLCRTPEKRKQFSESVMAISYEYGLEKYCKRILEPSFWGGEPELLVISRLIRRPVKVYIHAAQAKNATGAGFVCIQTYGEEFSKEGKRKPIRLLYNGENHYDLLL